MPPKVQPLTTEQDETLVRLVFDERERIEYGNSKRGPHHNRKKNIAWEKITEKYNLAHPENTRKVGQLRDYYLHRKSIVKANKTLASRYSEITRNMGDEGMEQKKKIVEEEFGCSDGLVLLMLDSSNSNVVNDVDKGDKVIDEVNSTSKKRRRITHSTESVDSDSVSRNMMNNTEWKSYSDQSNIELVNTLANEIDKEMESQSSTLDSNRRLSQMMLQLTVQAINSINSNTPFHSQPFLKKLKSEVHSIFAIVGAEKSSIETKLAFALSFLLEQMEDHVLARIQSEILPAHVDGAEEFDVKVEESEGIFAEDGSGEHMDFGDVKDEEFDYEMINDRTLQPFNVDFGGDRLNPTSSSSYTVTPRMNDQVPPVQSDAPRKLPEHKQIKEEEPDEDSNLPSCSNLFKPQQLPVTTTSNYSSAQDFTIVSSSYTIAGPRSNVRKPAVKTVIIGKCHFCLARLPIGEKMMNHMRTMHTNERRKFEPTPDPVDQIRANIGGGRSFIRKGGVEQARQQGLSASKSSSIIGKCVFCKARYPIGEKMMHHMRTAHPNQKSIFDISEISSFSCKRGFCDFSTSTQFELNEHEKVFHSKYRLTTIELDKGIRCPRCFVGLRYLSTIVQHFKIYHKSLLASQAHIYKCGDCWFTSSKFYEMIEHWGDQPACSPLRLQFVHQALRAGSSFRYTSETSKRRAIGAVASNGNISSAAESMRGIKKF